MLLMGFYCSSSSHIHLKFVIMYKLIMYGSAAPPLSVFLVRGCTTECHRVIHAHLFLSLVAGWKTPEGRIKKRGRGSQKQGFFKQVFLFAIVGHSILGLSIYDW